jgi:hypothetical protein
MEIQALRLLLTEQDLHQLAVQGLQTDLQIREVRVRVTLEGILLSGVYPTSLLDVPFTTLWQVSVRGGLLAARLADIQTGDGDGGLDVFSLLGPGAVRGTIMNAIAQAVQAEDSVRVQGETILVDPDRLAAGRGWPVQTNLSAVHCYDGGLVLEAGSGAGVSGDVSAPAG